MNCGHTSFEQAVSVLPSKISRELNSISDELKLSAQEIRLLKGFSPMITVNNRLFDINGEAVGEQELNECLLKMCEESIHSHQNELSAGYLSLKGGHRAGFAATAVYDLNRRLMGFRDISAVVIRIAKRFNNISLPLIKAVFDNGICGLIIAGAPAVGKTTMLRDLAYQISLGSVEGCERVAVIDERGELGSCGKGLVLKGYDKAQGMLMALRLLSPQVMVCDEIGNLEETEAVKQALNSGVCVITTVHASSKQELMRRSVSRELILSGAFKKAVILSDKPDICSIKEVMDIERCFKADGNSFYNDKLCRYGDKYGGIVPPEGFSA